MPSAPTAPGTVTDPISVSEPPEPTRKPLTMPFAPVSAYR
jgi:hypothetical protein